VIPNFLLKQKARAALKGNWQVALMVALIASLPSLVSQVMGIMTSTTYADAMNSLMATMQNNPAADPQSMLLAAGITPEGYLPTLLVSVLAGLISPFLTLGMINYTLGLLRGVKDAPITAVFSRSGCFWKGIGLNVMMYLRVLLWMLPGMAAMIAGVFIPWDWLAMALLYAGMVASIVFGIRASMHYAMALRFMGDDPSLGINQCLRESLRMMRHRKLMLFSLELSFIGWNFLLSVLQMLAASMFGNVIGSTCYMVLNMVLTVYMQTSVCAFYDAYRAQPERPSPINTGDIGAA